MVSKPSKYTVDSIYLRAVLTIIFEKLNDSMQHKIQKIKCMKLSVSLCITDVKSLGSMQ